VKDGEPIFGPVKDKRNRPRVVPVPDVVMTALSVHVGRYGLGPEDLIFTGARGGPLRRNTFSEAWGEVARPLGIPLGDGFHQLRHFYASALKLGTVALGASFDRVEDRGTVWDLASGVAA
jgi:integrase